MRIFLDKYDHTPDKIEVPEFPKMCVLAISYVCNAKCPHCPYTNSDIREKYKNNPFMEMELYKKIVEECANYNSILRITGGGEPLLHPNIIEMIEIAKSKGLTVGLITNGSLLNEEKAYKLISNNVDLIEFSVDAGTKDEYEKIRVGLSWNVTVSNITRAVELRNKLDSKTKFVASIILQKGVDVKRAQKFWEEIVDFVQLRKFLTWGVVPETKGIETEPYLPENAPCPYPFERIFINTLGEVALCPDDIFFKMKMGNVKEQSIKEIWNSDNYNYIRHLHVTGNFDKIPLCKLCPNRRYKTWKYNYLKIVEILKKEEK